MSMRKKRIILLQIASSTIIAMFLHFLEMNLTIRTILVTVLMALLFSIRAILTMPENEPK